MRESLEQFFAEKFTTNEKEIFDVIKYFRPVKAKKDEILVKSGNVCRDFFFIGKGCLKAFLFSSS
ncbi:hypothetical protein ACT3CD_13540 [Geofilum sp. OHC36d9]|uniref:hypothetical protein n=1 Tax=Geofilum sp. OHC36d9 TaxID=3458413 RepID=UPI0040335028